ncbi:MAG: hypothetical protein KF787_00570 [Phycisphaeraceae bacterium]|nr:hypothetical protein [Phycisphaerae bacterium]MBX3391116.1 hypothetical protein [Phycisphaeraceae bacterium]HRJ49839.1 hypothetical protein [Phycisphaerales bacterium]
MADDAVVDLAARLVVLPLEGDLAGQYRIRTGDDRVQFTVNAKGQPLVVTVVKVGHRDGFYDG